MNRAAILMPDDFDEVMAAWPGRMADIIKTNRVGSAQVTRFRTTRKHSIESMLAGGHSAAIRVCINCFRGIRANPRWQDR